MLDSNHTGRISREPIADFKSVWNQGETETGYGFGLTSGPVADLMTTSVRVCPCVSISIHMTSVAVQQYTYQHVGPWTQHAGPSCGLFGTSMAVRVCPSLSFSTHRTSVAVHQYTYQHVGPWTQHVVHTGRPWVPARTHWTSVCVSVAVCQHTQDVRVCPCVSVSTHRTSVAVHQYTYQHIVHTGRPWVSVSTHMTYVGVPHTGRPWLSISTHICTLVLGLSTLTLPVECSGDFGPRGLSVQYTQDVRVCPSAHTGRPWLSVCVRVCPSAHRKSVAVHQLSVQYTQDVCGCPPAHTGRPWQSVSKHRTSMAVRGCPCVSVCVRQHTQDVRGCPSVHISARWSLDSARWLFPWTVRVILAHVGCLYSTHWTFVGVRQHTLDVRGYPWLSVSTYKTSVAVRLCPCVRQHTHDVRGCPSVHISARCTHRTSVAVRVCPLAHTRRQWLSISTHISTLVLGLSTLTLPVDCSGDFGPRGLSVQYTQDVHGCPSAHTGRPCVSVSTHKTSMAVCVCPCVSFSTHRTSVAVHHTHRTSVGVRQHTLDVRVCVRGCLSAHTGRPCVSVCVRQHTQDVRGCPSVHISAGRWSWNSKSAKECVTTHLPNQLAPKMDGAEARDLYPAVGARARPR
ncbi:hypothetical protein YC2023_071684 [Brassica napus]